MFLKRPIYNMSATLANWIEKQTKSTLLIIALAFFVLVWIVDYGTGPFLSASIFYLVPIAFAAWWLNGKIGAGLSLISAIAWLVTDIVTNPTIPNPLTPYWNAAVRLGFFLIVTFSLASLRQARLRQEELMSFVIHDLRSPLGNIITGLSMLTQMIDREDHDVRSLVDMGISSGRRMLIQINSLLDLARLENGKLPVQMDTVEIRTVVEQALDQVSLLAARKKVALVVEGIMVETAVLADQNLLERVLINLLGNAIQFSLEGGKVTIAAAPEAERLIVQVSDQGPGIPLQWEKQVFRKFEQMTARKAGAATGSGLGLAFCKLAIEAQNGRIWLETPPHNQGTMVCFSLVMV